MVEFFQDQGLTPDLLRRQYLEQITLLRKLFLEQDFSEKLIKLRHNKPPEKNGGFLALESPHALQIQGELMERGVFTDARDNILRIGPAPYTTTMQIEECIRRLSESVNKVQ
ncbi:MAG: hypothetical protein U5K69_02550 [Balneolaceae bacterium]|nr:hypothetical protein [Balneolaceae bacterium]